MSNRVGQYLGDYHLVRLLGQGSFADVYLGQHLHLKSAAAVKVLHTRLAEGHVSRFLNEAQAIKSLEHPHILRVLDCGVQEGTPFLVMDYAADGTLRQRYQQGIPLSLKIILHYVQEIAAALQYAHDQRQIHGDVKPENMLSGQHGEVLLSDFGIIQLVRKMQPDETLSIVGSVDYMAPEQFDGKVLFASDQYALGIVVYEWLCGERPFQGSAAEIASQHVFAAPASLREKNPIIPPAVEEVVMMALAKEPWQRFTSVQAFAEALERACVLTPPFLSGSTVTPSSPAQFLPALAAAAADQPLQAQDQPTVTLPVPSMELDYANRPTLANLPLPPVRTPPASLVTPSFLGQSDHILPGGYSGGLQLLFRPKKVMRISLLALAIILIAGTLMTFFVLSGKSSQRPALTTAIGVSRMPDGSSIGISDGTFAFDTNRPDGALKRAAAAKLKAHEMNAAQALWQAALQQDPDDAEALIYLEDQRVLASGSPHITLVVGTVLTGDSILVGRGDLQGAYVAQKEFNDGLKLSGGVQVCLLIANSGSHAEYATAVARQLVQEAEADKTLLGVMGWPFGASTAKVIPILGAAHIPMVSPTASDDFLSGISPYFFRVVPPIHRQGVLDAQYAEHFFHAKNVALFLDPADAYSEPLATAFEQQFKADGNSVVATERYTVGQAGALPGFLRDALNARPDLIYFAGYADDVRTLLASLPTSGQFAHIQVLGGEALYEDYHNGIRTGIQRLHFSSSAYSNEWDDLNLSLEKPLFFDEYQQDFAGTADIAPNTNSMLSYDAMLALLVGSGKTSIPGNLEQGLKKITGSSAIQGASGAISFGPDGDPVEKAIVLLGLEANGDLRTEAVEGNLLLGR